MKQFAVIGLGRFGTSVLKNLTKMNYEVLALDADARKVQELSSIATHIVQADATDEDTLRALGLQNMDVAIVSIANKIQVSIMAVMILKELGVPYVVAKASNELHAKILKRVGVDKVVFPEQDMAARVVHNLISSSVLDFIELSSEYSIAEVQVPAELAGNALRDLDLREKFGLNILAIKRGEVVEVPPKADSFVEEGDVLVAVGRNDDLRSLGSTANK